MPHRYFTTDISGGTAVLSGADAHHLAHVMRARPGETVTLCDGKGTMPARCAALAPIR